MAKKQRDKPAQPRDDDQRAPTDEAKTSDEVGIATAAQVNKGDPTLHIEGAPPQLNPDAGPSTLRPDLAPGVDARVAGLPELDRKGIDAQLAQHTHTSKDVLGETITRHSGPGVDEMLKKAGLHGLSTPGVKDLLPPESKGGPPDLAPGHNPSLYADGETKLKEYVPPPGAQEKAEKLAADEQAARQARADQAEARKAFEKRQYEEPKKMTDPDADPGGSSTVAGVGVTTPPVFKGDWVSHPVQGDGSSDPPTRDPDPFRAHGGVMPGVVDPIDPADQYVEVQVQGAPKIPQSGFTDGVNPRDGITPVAPTGGVPAPHTGGDDGGGKGTGPPTGGGGGGGSPKGMVGDDGNAPVGLEQGTAPVAVAPDAPDAAPDAVAVSHVAPEATLATGGPPPGFDAGDQAPAPQLSADADHVGDFGGPPPDAQDADPGAQPGGLDDDGDG